MELLTLSSRSSTSKAVLATTATACGVVGLACWHIDKRAQLRRRKQARTAAREAARERLADRHRSSIEAPLASSCIDSRFLAEADGDATVRNGRRMRPGFRTVHMVSPRRLSLASRSQECDSQHEAHVSGETVPRFCLCEEDSLSTATTHSAADASENTALSVPIYTARWFEEDGDNLEAAAAAVQPVNDFFCLDGDDSDSSDGNSAFQSTLEDMFSFDINEVSKGQHSDLEDLFAFDLDDVAAAVRRGDSLEQLQEIIENLMTANLESMTQKPTLSNLAEAAPEMPSDISGLMTPGRLSPTSSAGGDDDTKQQSFDQHLNARLAEVATPARKNSRQSSVPHLRIPEVGSDLSHPPHNSSEGVQHSARTNSMREFTDCPSTARRNRRKSLLQAAEVVELAGLAEEPGLQGEEWGASHLTPEQLTRQLQIVQQAIEGARQKHRQSIVQTLGGPPAFALQ